ncbi:MAG: hypothetical protein K6B28_05975, partial [Lachnospiraceae bacterium]|nr:hypothetical protein [Lachnospiraceae bacterium]
MKAQKKAWIIIFISIFMLSTMACGKADKVTDIGDHANAGDFADVDAPVDTDHTDNTQQSATEEETQKTTEESRTTESRITESNTTESRTTESRTTESNTTESRTIENNGGYFLKAGNEVFYREHQLDTLCKNAVWGEFIENPSFNDEYGYDPAAVSQICSIDTETFEKKEIYEDSGYGKLFSDGKRLYLNEYDGKETYVKYISFDGDNEGMVASGEIVGCDAKSGLLAITSWEAEPYTCILSLYKGTELLNEFRSEEGFEFAGITDEGIFYMVPDYMNGNADYYQLTADQDKEIHLGSMGDFEYEMPVHEQFLSDGENVYFVLSA